MNVSKRTSVIAAMMTVLVTTAYHAFVADADPENLLDGSSEPRRVTDRADVSYLSAQSTSAATPRNLSTKILAWSPPANSLKRPGSTDPFAWTPVKPPAPKIAVRHRPQTIKRPPPPPPPVYQAPPPPRARLAARIAGRISMDGQDSLWIENGSEFIVANQGVPLTPEHSIEQVTSESIVVADSIDLSERVLRWEYSSGSIEMHP